MTLREIVDEELLKEEFNQEKANEIKNEIYNKLKTFKELENEKISVNEANPNYEKSNYKDAETLYNTLSSASKAFGLKIAEPEWIEMPNRATATDWTETADEYFGVKKRDYDCYYDKTIFLD